MITLKKYIKRAVNYLLDKAAGRSRFQGFFELLHRISLFGMNFGNIDLEYSGEKEVVKKMAIAVESQLPVIFDAGANVGKYTLMVNSVLSQQARIYCFEPSKRAFCLLKENLEGCQNVKLYNFGLGRQEKDAFLYSEKEDSESGSVFNRPGFAKKYKETIKLLRLDDFCRKNKIEHINLLKLDIEGNEFYALKGADELIISSAIDFIQFEFGGTDMDSKIYFRDFFCFLSPNYKIFRVLKNGLFPISSYNERYEIFSAINYLAVSRKLTHFN